MLTEETTVISKELLDEAVDYHTHIQQIAKLFEQGRTTNNDNRPNMLDYTKLYLQRTSRWDKRGIIDEELIHKLESFPRKMIWLVLNEGWCGDSAQSLPFINKMADMSENITLKIILRDKNFEIMDEFLTHGARSIPKLIALDEETLEVLGTWGPRPKVAYYRFKAERATLTSPIKKHWKTSTFGTQRIEANQFSKSFLNYWMIGCRNSKFRI